MTKKRLIITLAIAAPAIALALALAFPGWSKLNCWTWEIDINSGDKRYTRYLFWTEISSRIEETWMTAALSEHKQEEREWHRVVTLSPNRRNSPHYSFHGALSDLRSTGQFLDYMDADEETRTQIALGIRKRWKEAGRDDTAGRYLQDIWNALLDGKPIVTQEIEQADAHQRGSAAGASVPRR